MITSIVKMQERDFMARTLRQLQMCTDIMLCYNAGHMLYVHEWHLSRIARADAKEKLSPSSSLWQWS